MSSFDSVAREWDKDKMHLERSVAIASGLEQMVPLQHSMKALEYGAGTGILSFLMSDRFSEITLMDNSREMIMICDEKVNHFQTKHIHPLLFDLEQMDYDPGQKGFDLIYNQMVLHHVKEIDLLAGKFYSLLNKDGYLAIADLYCEDGSFHGPDIDVHKGFDPDKLTKMLKAKGFKETHFQTCFEIKRESGRIYPVFLLVTKK